MEDSDDIFAWTNGKRLTKKKVQAYIKGVLAVELDCEKRAVENIKKFGLPCDIDDYIQKANAYVYFYQFVLKRRKWYSPGKAPYEIPEVYSKMPTKFLNRYDRMPAKYLKLYDEYCV
jgi:hypothetical protein